MAFARGNLYAMRFADITTPRLSNEARSKQRTPLSTRALLP